MLVAAARNRDVFALRETATLRAGGHGDVHGAVGIELGEGHILRPRASAVLEIAARLEPGRLHLLDEVGDGFLFAQRGGAAAFEFIRRQCFDVRG